MDERDFERAEIVLYQSDGANVPVRVRYAAGTFWMTQSEMGELFGVDRSVASRHLSNIYESEELQVEGTCAKIAHVAENGREYQTGVYNLDAIISVGYRVNSKSATRFRQWATRTLNEYVTKGFVLNDEMLKNGRPFGEDYFDELLARIRDIRASERRLWLKVGDIFQECSFDYDPNSETARAFYSSIQNKMHFAVTGHTAAEIVFERCDPEAPHMGLTSWKGGPEGRIHSSDVGVAKNYLTEEEVDTLNRLVSMLLDNIELQARDHILMSMADCADAVDQFLRFNRRDVLVGKGTRSMEQARRKAKEAFRLYQPVQDAAFENDLEKHVKRLGGSR